MENKKTNFKGYSDVKEYQRVISSKRDAIEVVVEIMTASRFDSDEVCLSTLTYINNVISDKKKVHATLAVIYLLTRAFPDDVELKLFIKGKETPIIDFLDDGEVYGKN
jgi:hypothetical protein